MYTANYKWLLHGAHDISGLENETFCIVTKNCILRQLLAHMRLEWAIVSREVANKYWSNLCVGYVKSYLVGGPHNVHILEVHTIAT